MAGNRLNLTRDQLASFLQDHEQIKQFELLFQTVDQEILPNSVTEANTLAGTAYAIGNEALSQITAAEQILDLLASAPVPENNNSITTDYIDYRTTAPFPTAVIGRTFWDGGQTLNVQQTLNVAGKVNEDNYYYIKADSAINKGQIVMFTGAVGASGVLRGAPATALGVNDGVRLMGVAAESIAANGFGMVQWSGTLRGFNTTGSPYGETWVDGDLLYYNPAYAGGLTKVEPTAPNVRAVIAAVVNAATAGSGSVVIRLSVGSVLGGTDSNVYINGLTGGDLLQYDSVDLRWENHAPSTITVGTATNLAGGLANQLAYQTAPGTTGFATVGTGLLLSGGTLSNSAPDQTVVLTGGTGISTSGTYPSFTITNTAPDQIVSLTAGTGISISGTYPSFTVTNSAPDQIVSLTGAGTTVVTGTYPSFTITSNDQYVGTVTSVGGTGTVNGITLTGTVTSSGSLTLGGTLSGVSLTSQVTGTLPVGNGGTGTATAFTAGSVVFAGASGVYSQDNANLFWDNTNDRLGVGTNSLNARLSLGSLVSNKVFALYDDGTNQYGMGIAGSQYRMFAATGANLCFGNYARSTDTFTEYMRVNGNGNVLINETTPSGASLVHNFEVNGDIMSTGGGSGLFWSNRSTAPTSGADWYGWYTTGGTIYLYNPAAGNIASINAATGIYTPLSDQAKKKDFEPSTIGLEAVMALKPTLFRMETDDSDAPKQLGFVAQEVKDHIPQAYIEQQNTDATGNDTMYIGLNDRPIIAALVKAVQELTDRVKELEGNS